MTRKEAIKNLEDGSVTLGTREIAIKALKEPERKHGHWIDEGEYVTTAYGTLPIHRCSNCNSEITIDEHDSFCPECGAIIDEEI